jgi:predicted Zn-dependent peptidase
MYTFVASPIPMSFLGIAYPYGGATEIEGSRGISHLMEHLMCKTFDNLLLAFKLNGISYNASTSDNQTIFYFSGIEANLNKFKDVLLKRLLKQDILWTQEAFEQEKLTVLQEYGDCFNNQTQGAYYNLLRKHYGYTGAIGFRTDIENFSYVNSIRYASGYRTPYKVCEVAQKPILAENWQSIQASAPRTFSFTADSTLELEPIPRDKKTFVGMLGSSSFNLADAVKLRTIIECLTDGLESPLYQEIREKRGLSYFSSGFLSIFGANTIPVFYASTNNDRVKELQEVYQQFFSDVSRYVTPQRFEACKTQSLIDKQKAELMPWTSAMDTVLAYVDPYAGLEDLTFDEAIEFSKKLNLGSLEPVSY